MNNSIALFEEREIRKVWHNEKWYFNIEDVVLLLTNSINARDYIKKVRKRDFILNEGWGQIVTPLKYKTLGGVQTLNFSDTEGILRIIQSIPSPKAEPFKLWLAKVGYERIEEINNPELAMDRMKLIYEQKGYPKVWIEQRERSIVTRHKLTDEWKERGANSKRDYAILTNEIYVSGFGLTAKQYKGIKNLVEQNNLRDSMTNIELALTNLGEAAAVEIHIKKDSNGINELTKDVNEAGEVIKSAKNVLEEKLNAPIVTEQNYIDITSANKKLK